MDADALKLKAEELGFVGTPSKIDNEIILNLIKEKKFQSSHR